MKQAIVSCVLVYNMVPESYWRKQGNPRNILLKSASFLTDVYHGHAQVSEPAKLLC
jgi:hypothetical protein